MPIELAKGDRYGRYKILEVLGEGVSGFALGATEMVVTRVHRHPIEPGGERRLGLVAIGLAEQRQEGVLGGVEGGVAITKHAETDAEHTVLVGAHEFVEGAHVAVEIPGDECRVFGCSVCHRGDSGVPNPDCHGHSTAAGRSGAAERDLGETSEPDTVGLLGDLGEPQQPDPSAPLRQTQVGRLSVDDGA